ncbi:MAG: aldehyde ferredoxin oxidoreductase family protein [Deltaproteobacteria bacterium]|nr:aldehyde ferredoxin oxidoreductase family protein [Deltaproteobacteria bacterium]
MEKSYMGRILMVDMGTGNICEETVPDKVYENYLGGLGLAASILYDRIPAGADPLGPDNILAFVSGLLTGTGTLFTGRWMVAAKSPLTGTWGDANCGGNFSPAIKKCGYDGIFFTGISEKPVYLSIINGKAELKDAAYLWGKDAVETEAILISEANDNKARVACIGPAGENLSLISGVSNDRGRLAARSGLGAVMGSKRLKALVLSGDHAILPNNRAEIKKLRLKTLIFVKSQPPLNKGSLNAYLGKAFRMLPSQIVMDGILYKMMLKKWGTVSLNQLSIEIGDSPVKNWKGTYRDFTGRKSAPINPDRIIAREVKKYFCYSCPLGCGGICKTKDMDGKDFETHKPEYETVVAFSGLLLNEDLDSIFYINELLNRAGMDSISAGATIAFAIECYEKKALKPGETNGLKLKWGDTKTIVALVEKMIKREGIGDILADGVKKAAERIGKGAQKYAMHAGGQELPMHDGRNDPGFALHYSVEATPGRHTMGAFMYYDMFQLWKKIKSLPSPGLMYSKDSKYVADEEKVIKAAACSKFMNVANGAGLCLFGAFLGLHRLPLFEWINAATGWDKTPEEYLEMGAAIQTLKQAFNVKQGVDPKSLKPNKRTLGEPPQENGPNKGRSVEIDELMKRYWEHFGWDPETGKPA